MSGFDPIVIPEEPGFQVESYEYKVQVWDQYSTPPKWTNTSSNRFYRDVWYPSLASARNARAQMKSGWRYNRQYRIIRRPVGAQEVVDEVLV